MSDAFKIEHIFPVSVTSKVALRRSDKIQSHFGALRIVDVKVGIMGGFSDSTRRWKLADLSPTHGMSIASATVRRAY